MTDSVSLTAVAAPSFREWQRSIVEAGGLPLVVVAGSRGKSTVSHLTQSMMRTGIRSACRTEDGVWIEGDLQQGELGPWATVMERLTIRDLDFAVWETDWQSEHAIPADTRIGGLVVTNLCSNRSTCLDYVNIEAAERLLEKLSAMVSPGGFVVVNGDDYQLADMPISPDSMLVKTGLGLDGPVMQAHHLSGGLTGWLQSGQLVIGTVDQVSLLGESGEMQFALNGAASFEVHNGLMAAAVGWLMGLRTSTIASTLREFRNDISNIPGSFNVTDVSGVSLVLDRPAPSWFLQPTIRAVRDMKKGRLITICDVLPDEQRGEAAEIGRLLGRISSVLFLVTGRVTDGIDWREIQTGAAQLDFPPLVVSFATMQAAVKKALIMARPGDAIFVLTDKPKQLQYLWR